MAWGKDSGDKRRAYQREWQSKNYDRIKGDRNERSRQWRLDHPEESREQFRRYREAHREELRAKAAAYKAAHPDRVKASQLKSRDRMRAYQRRLYVQTRSAVIEAYGGACVCCSERNPAFLTVDHVNNDGGAGRKAGGGEGSGIRLYRWLAKQRYPRDRFQLLCYNCNCSKQHDQEGHRLAHERAILIDGGARGNGAMAEPDRSLCG